MNAVRTVKHNASLQTILHMIGLLLIIQGGIFIIPLISVVILKDWQAASWYIIPAVISTPLGFLFRKVFKQGKIFFIQSLLICGLGWIILSAFSCMPFMLGAGLSFTDAYFETVSGYTTTGITILTKIGILSPSLIFWRSLIQWIGGLGIITFFLAVSYRSNGAFFHLFSAESHKIESSRPSPSVYKTVLILWGLYGALTLAEITMLKIFGLSFYDAICHSFTTLSTGGFSPYDSSIDYYRQNGFKHYRAIEYTMAFFMFAGGMNFLLHYKLFTGRFKQVISNVEFRNYLLITLGATGLILIDNYMRFPGTEAGSPETRIRTALFTVSSIISTTGYGTTDINASFFPALAKQIILMLMLIGGCVGSTGGGIKVMRITVLFKLFIKQITKQRYPNNAQTALVIDGSIYPKAELERVSGLFFGWLILILGGGMITALFTDLDSWQSFSGMFSALGNIGPCYISVAEMSALPKIVKWTYILGMLAGRLEILPVLILFDRKSWRS